jgi:serine/threonine-protein kinase
VLDGGTVTVVLSLGKERYDVPKVRGVTEEAARDRLAEANLAYGESVGRWSEDVEEGVVLGSDPAPGTTLRPGTVVDLVVSKGPRPITVKDWTGEEADRAEQALEDKGLVVERASSEYSDTVPEGDVISQSPASGTLFRGQTVTITVSQGPELVEVPGGLVASGVDSATERLEALGFEVEVIRDGSGYIGLEYVFSVDPGSGTMVPRGSTITLRLV